MKLSPNSGNLTEEFTRVYGQENTDKYRVLDIRVERGVVDNTTQFIWVSLCLDAHATEESMRPGSLSIYKKGRLRYGRFL